MQGVSNQGDPTGKAALANMQVATSLALENPSQPRDPQTRPRS